ncbi:MAG: ATP-binding cassette domain-containing protein [Candidatus Marinimicrobia bacterium]|nr:ATP-binding cassette domain-containing protein [Candidatus Neomarinimicrobiota bacterium]
MVQLNNISVQFGDRVLFRNVSANLAPGKRYGIVGANGSGKTTLLKLISGEQEASEGEIRIPSTMRLGVLKQDQFEFENIPIIDVVLMGNESLWMLLNEKRELELKRTLSEYEGSRLAELEHRLSDVDGYNADGRAAILLKGLGLRQHQLQQPMSTLSGGYKLRVLIGQCLFSEPDILLLDEPNNHLDIYSIAWLGEYLKEFSGIVIVVSHDQYFLNQISTHIIDIDYEMIKIYPGNYNAFLTAKRLDFEQKQIEIERLEKKRQELQEFYERFRAKATKARQAVSRKKQIDRMDDIVITRSTRIHPSFKFSQKRPSGQQVLEISGLKKTFGDLLVLNNLDLNVNRGDRIAVIGPNGVGKSTLIKILAGVLEADEGKIQWGFESDVGYFAQNHRDLIEPNTTVFDWLYAYTSGEKVTSVRSILGQILFSADDIYKTTDILSGGEAARLIFAKLMVEQHNILLLDEPSNHLDLEAIESLEEALLAFPGTVIFVSHNRYFLNHLATGILELRFDGYSFYPGNYDDFIARQQQDYLDRDIKTRIKQTAKKVVTSDQDLSKQLGQERRQLSKELSRIEQKVKKSEEQISIMENRIRELDELFRGNEIFSPEKQEEFQKMYTQQQELKLDLEIAVQEWESEHREYDRINARIHEIDSRLSA